MDEREIIVPILDESNAKLILRSCLEEFSGGRKFLYSPSRNLKTEDYKRPKHGSLSSSQIETLDKQYTCEVIRFFAERYYHFLKVNGYSLDKPVCKIISNFANPDLTGRDLELIVRASDDQLIRIAKGTESPL